MFEGFTEGVEYNYQEINLAIGYQPKATSPRGIIPIPKGEHEAIMLRINLRKNLYDEEYDPGSPVLHYIGEGLPEHGDQKRKRGNKLLAESQEKDIHLFVHTKKQKKGFWTYRGIWKLLDYNANFPSNKITPRGAIQKVFKFRLVKKGVDDPLQALKSTKLDEVPTPIATVDSLIGLQLRDDYDNRCQICGNTISIPGKGNYSMIRYLKPPDPPHNGPDIRENMMVLCPSHNAEMAFGVFFIDNATMKIIHHNIANQYHDSPIRLNEDHQLSHEYLEYHKDEFCRAWSTHIMRSALDEVHTLSMLIEGGENDQVEFKSTFSYNSYIERGDKNLELAVFKAIGGFMNGEGGTLLIGVMDDGIICGIENDLSLLGDLDAEPRIQLRDKFKRRMSQRMTSSGFKDVHLKFKQFRFVNTDGTDVCIIEVRKSQSPVYLVIEGTKCLPVRLDGRTKCYDPEEALDYIKTHRPDFLE